MKKICFIALLPLLLVSCAKDTSQETVASAPAPSSRSLSQRMTESNGYKQDAKGNWVPQNDRRSSFESKGEANYAKKDFNKQEYKTGDYAKKSWWGSKDYAPKAYAGNTDGSRFKTSSALQGKGAREAGTDAKLPDPYQTADYATGTARESRTSPIKKSGNHLSENRQKTFQQPEIIDWREQRSLSMDQSKGILGR